MDSQMTPSLQSGRDDQITRLARVLAYIKTGAVEFDGKNPLDDPRWVADANVYIDYILTGGKIK